VSAAVHSHVCMKCAEAKKNVVWMHGDDKAGVIGLHTCPECGTVNWRKVVLPPAELPQQKASAAVDFNTVLGYILFAVIVATIGYCAFVYVKKIRGNEKPVEQTL
jgi:hypothetical protein